MLMAMMNRYIAPRESTAASSPLSSMIRPHSITKITGISARRMSNCTIMEKDTSTNTGKGCSYEITGASFPDDYPADDAKVTVTGVLNYNPETFARILQVPKDQVVTE